MILTAYPWTEIELIFTASVDYPNPYTHLDVWADFTHSSGAVLRRPAFWDGYRTWKIRFASPFSSGFWDWITAATVADPGLAGQRGQIQCAPSPEAANPFQRSGFWRMSPGGRSLIHADGTPALLAADTAWALPWRATPEQCEAYAADRQRKGFNAVLLMTVQPDMQPKGRVTAQRIWGLMSALKT